MQAIKSGFMYLCLCWLHVLTLFQKLLAKYRHEPDFTDVILFNDKTLKSNEMHKNGNCPRRFCTPCRVNRLIAYIDNAQVCMDIAHLVITHDSIFKAVLAAWYRGVNVRIVTDPEMVHIRGSQMRKLCSHCIPIHVAAKRTIMHHKFTIIDGEQRILQLGSEERLKAARLLQRRGIVMTGSLNWTEQGTRHNYENVVITSNRKVIARYQEIFDNLYNYYAQLTIIFSELYHSEIEKIPDRNAKDFY